MRIVGGAATLFLSLKTALFASGFAGAVYQKTIDDFSAVAHKATRVDFLKGQLLFAPPKKVGRKTLAYTFDEPLPSHSSSLPLLSKDGVVGFAAAFRSMQNSLEFPSPRHEFFSNPIDNGSYTIELYVWFASLRGLPVVLERKGAFVGLGSRGNQLEHQSVSLFASNRRLLLHCSNFFRFKSRSLDLRLNQSPPLETERWYHIRIDFNALTGRLAKFIDRELVEVAYATEDGTPTSTPYYSSFRLPSRSPLVLGRDFLGKVDEVRFQSYDPSALPTGDFFDAEPQEGGRSEFVSRVFGLRAESHLSRVRLGLVAASTDARRALISFYYRSSGGLFLESRSESELPWRQVPLATVLESMPAHRFAQFKIVAERKDAKGGAERGALVASNLRFDYVVRRAPLPAPSWALYKHGEKSITLAWKASPNPQIKGYKLTYSALNSAAKQVVFLPTKNPPDAALSDPNHLPKQFQHELNNLEENTLYEVYLTALDEEGNESEPSKKLRLQTNPFASTKFIPVREEVLFGHDEH